MSASIPKVVVVDDSREITDLIHNYSLSYESEFTTIVTNLPKHVLRILEENENVRLLVTDFKMPAMNGLELVLEVKSRYPDMQFIMMTGYGTPELRSQVEQTGAVRFMEKPFRISELIGTIRDIVSSSQRGFGGYVPALQLPDIVQLLAIGRGDGVLEIISSDHNGRVIFEKGEIVHAEDGEVEGAEAFYRMFRWPSGRFVVSDKLPRKVQRTVHDSWEGLLIEAARLQDEASIEEEEAKKKAEKLEEKPVHTVPELVKEKPAKDLSKLFEHVEMEEDLLPQTPSARNPIEDLGEDARKLAERALRANRGLAFFKSGQKKEGAEASGNATARNLDARRAAVPSEVSIKTDKPAREGEIKLDDLDSIHAACVAAGEKLFPQGRDKIGFKELQLNKLPPSLRSHLAFHVHWMSTSVFRLEGSPFEMKDPRVSKAAVDFLEALLDAWQVNREQFGQMLESACRFQIGRAVAPGKAVGEYLVEIAEGSPRRMGSAVESMVDLGVLEELYRPLAADIKLIKEPLLTAEATGKLVTKIISSGSANLRQEEQDKTLQRLIELAKNAGWQGELTIGEDLLARIKKSRG